MTATTALEAVLKRDRLIVIGGLIGVIALAWLYLLLNAGTGRSGVEMAAQTTRMAGPHNGMPTDGSSMSDMVVAAMQPVVWTPGYAVLMFFMWRIMMIAMMLPSASPMILLYAAVNRKRHAQDAPYVPAGIFALGYVAVWGGFSLAAVALQWGLEQSGLLSSAMATTSVALAAVLLIAAGIWQLTPLQHVCLKHCRAPLLFFAHHWRKGRLGAFRMGVEYGAFCLGCCWFLMGLLFYGGAMNLYWIVGLALFVLAEKALPTGHWIGSAAGGLLIIWGGALLLGSI